MLCGNITDSLQARVRKRERKRRRLWADVCGHEKPRCVLHPYSWSTITADAQ